MAPRKLTLILFTLLTTAAFLGALELGFRRLALAPSLSVPGDVDNREGCLRPSMTRGWESVPGRCFRDANGVTGADGLRPGDPSQLRIFLAGDSIAAQQQWIGAARDRLAVSLGREVIIANSGVSGYGTCQELTTAQEVGRRYDPAALILQTCPNDLGATPILAPAGEGRVRHYIGEAAFDFPRLILRSRLATFLTLRAGAALYAKDLSREQLGASFDQCLAGFSELARGWGAGLLVVQFPTLADPGDEGMGGHLGAEAELGRRTAAAGVPMLDLRPVLEAAGPMASLRRAPEDVIHPGQAAQRVAGEALADALIARGIIPGAAPEAP